MTAPDATQPFSSRRALAKFQATHSLPATGYFGPLTRALLITGTSSASQ